MRKIADYDTKCRDCDSPLYYVEVPLQGSIVDEDAWVNLYCCENSDCQLFRIVQRS